jgi:large subunit ribosomal protein L13
VYTKTFMVKSKPKAGEPNAIQPNWWVVDAENKIVGRLARDIAVVLMGKDKPLYTPNVDCGDCVVVLNVDKLVFTGKKWEQKEYRWYTGYPGQKTEKAGKRFERRPELILYDAVRRMLPKSKLGVKMLDKLKLYSGTDHPHQAQQPQPREMGVRKANVSA